ncbi:M43 family zinc metalloprotease [uncultured Algibacter sp.]|uniref:M43 family zinc metalloprotease n=1 Tax=uncultured Algibacter sp. TaxID=298659 RepID=UPI0032177CBD
MKKTLTLSILFLLFAFNMQAQNHKKCAAMENLEYRKKLDPTLESRMAEIEAFTQKKISEKKNFQNKISGQIITIPVVVHVLHRNARENISEAQIQSQIDVLNEDFRRTNPDANNRWPQATDTQIEFCLSKVDPNGNATTGITRKRTSREDWGIKGDEKDSAKGGIDAWDTTQYLNMWVVPEITLDIITEVITILGYAQFPGADAKYDGIVMVYDAFGRVGALKAPHNGGRTVTHEVGHWLNLEHIWGDGVKNCGDDLVSDTPTHRRPNYGCSVGQKSCGGSIEMPQNYMDYSDDSCMNLFTKGQKDRMRAVLEAGGPRRSIALSDKCGAPTTPQPMQPTCTDGIRNGNETGIDCGGSSCSPCFTPDPGNGPTGSGTILHEGFFETGWDGWSDGGNDCFRYSGSRSKEGNFSIKLRDNSGVASSMTSESFNLTSYNQVEVSFYFYAFKFNNNQDFWLRFNNGSGWETVRTWVKTTDFENKTFYQATVTLNTSQYSFSANSQFRFQSDASENVNQVFIDQVIITGLKNGARSIDNVRIDNLRAVRTLDTDDEGLREEDFIIYPNPIKGDILHVKISNELETTYRIFNMVGQTVISGKIAKEVNVSSLDSGMYFIEINDGEETSTKKFIKK